MTHVTHVQVMAHALVALLTSLTSRTSHMSHASRLTMGWLRLVGSLKLQVSFAEYSLFYRALLRKRDL